MHNKFVFDEFVCLAGDLESYDGPDETRRTIYCICRRSSGWEGEIPLNSFGREERDEGKDPLLSKETAVYHILRLPLLR